MAAVRFTPGNSSNERNQSIQPDSNSLPRLEKRIVKTHSLTISSEPSIYLDIKDSNLLVAAFPTISNHPDYLGFVTNQKELKEYSDHSATINLDLVYKDGSRVGFNDCPVKLYKK